MLGIERLRPEPQLVETALPREIGFGEGRALVGRNRLVADQHDAAGEAILAQ